MRIIAGRLGGRTFDSPRSNKTHPMSDKARGGLFNALGDITGLTVLDSFAGSGALAFEALSRGAKHAILIDNDKSAQKAITDNINKLSLNSSAKLISAGAGPWLETSNDTFDLILCDPPYDKLQTSLLSKVSERLELNGTFVLSWPGKADLPKFPNLKQIAHRDYGDAQLIFYKR